MKELNHTDAREKIINAIISLIIMLILIIFIVLGIFFFSEGAVVQASDEIPAIARSFSQYFSPQILRAADKMMKERFNCQSEGYWKIWTYGFHRKCKRPEGKLEIILNWDGMYYIKDLTPEVTGDWTQFK